MWTAREQKYFSNRSMMISKLIIYLGAGAIVIFSLRFLKERREAGIIRKHHAKLREQDAAVHSSFKESEKEPGEFQ